MELSILNQNCDRCGAAIQERSAICPSCRQPAADPAVDELLRRIQSTGASAIWGFAETGCSSLGCATIMLHYLTQPNPDAAAAASRALKATSDSRVLREMVILLAMRRWLGHEERGKFIQAEHGDESIAAVINENFSRGGSLRAGVLVELLNHSDYHVREAAADLLQYHLDPAVQDALANVMLHDRDEHVRARAAYALGKTCDPAHMDDLIQAMRDDSPVVIRQAAHALGHLGSCSVPAATAALQTGTPEVALHSARVLSRVASAEAIQALIETMWRRQGLARLYAEQALAQMGPDVLVPLLQKAIHYSESVAIREGITYVLRTMSLPPREAEIVAPVVAAAERLNAAIELPAAAYRALGELEGLTPEELGKGLSEISPGA